MSSSNKGWIKDRIVKLKTEDLVFSVHEYDIDPKSNHIYLMGSEAYSHGQDEPSEEPGVEYTMANRFIRNLNLTMRNVDDGEGILVHMKTCGGDWQEGMAIHNIIRACPNPITILCYTHARSMSSLILQAADKRVMMPDSYFMFHDGTIGVEGTVKQVHSSIDFGKYQDKRMMQIYVDAMKRRGKYSHRSKKWIEKWLRDQMNKKEDVYLTAQETVNLGLADEIFGNNDTYDWPALLTYDDVEDE